MAAIDRNVLEMGLSIIEESTRSVCPRVAAVVPRCEHRRLFVITVLGPRAKRWVPYADARSAFAGEKLVDMY